jgi:hypothetical protein
LLKRKSNPIFIRCTAFSVGPRIKLLIGPEWELYEAMSRSEYSKAINTSYVERLNLTIRRSVADLQRKTNAMCKSEQSLTDQLEVLRCYYNFLRPHSSLNFGRVTRTTAQQASLVDKRLTRRTIFTARIIGKCDRGFQNRMRARAIGQLHLASSGWDFPALLNGIYRFRAPTNDMLT